MHDRERPIAVLQLIDSLAAGGAERVSVNLANALAERGMGSFLCATRSGGPLEKEIDPRVKRCILGKRSALDPLALSRLVRYIRRHRIDIIHAHSSSIFTAVMCRPFTGVRIVWHDHNGYAERLSERRIAAIRMASRGFDFAVTVNDKLLEWSRAHLHLDPDRIQYLPNFAECRWNGEVPDLPGERGHRIVCLANLRPQKDQPTLLEAFRILAESYPKWHLLMVGKDWEDDYSRGLKETARKDGLEHRVHFLGSRSDIPAVLAVSTIGVLSSQSEGLPVALLEYGLSSLPVVCTEVGQCADVLDHGRCGKLVPPGDPEALSRALQELIEDSHLCKKLGERLQERISDTYGKESVLERLISYYEKVLDA